MNKLIKKSMIIFSFLTVLLLTGCEFLTMVTLPTLSTSTTVQTTNKPTVKPTVTTKHNDVHTTTTKQDIVDPSTVPHKHVWDSGTVTKKPECLVEGEMIYYCHCGAFRIDPIAALNHEYVDGICIHCGDEPGTLGLSFQEYNNGYSVSIGDATDSHIVIPSEYNGKPVIHINMGGFENNTNLKSIVLPDSLISIGNNAFFRCSSLESVTFGSNLETIGRDAFAYCGLLKDVTFPESLIDISYWAFNECTSLESIVLPSKLTTLSYGVFYGCTSLKNIQIPDTVTSIEGQVFSGCVLLENIDLPSNLSSIGEYAFRDCPLLDNIIIPKTVSEIGEGAFEKCINIKEITIPEGVQTIAYSTFYGCSSLVSVYLPNSLISIEGRAFYECVELTTVDIKEGLESIGLSAFDGCQKLYNISLPSTMKVIESYAFYCCTYVGDSLIKNCINLEKIGDSTFAYCDRINNLNIGSKLVELSSGAIYGSGINNITVAEDNPKYKTVNKLNVVIEKDTNVLIFGTDDLIIPYGVTKISAYAFAAINNGMPGNVCIPNTVTSIEKQAFSYAWWGTGTVYFLGTEEEWKNISIDSGNDLLLNANIIFEPEHEHGCSKTFIYHGNCITDGYERKY